MLVFLGYDWLCGNYKTIDFNILGDRNIAGGDSPSY